MVAPVKRVIESIRLRAVAKFTNLKLVSFAKKEAQMVRKFCGLVFFALVVCLPGPPCLGQEVFSQVQKQQERYTVSLDLEFSRKSGNSLDGTLSVLFGADPNGYATGFLVGDGLVLTAYHVVSANLSDAKKINLGFRPQDELSVKVYVNGCRAKILKVDKGADLALLEICGSQRAKAPTFEVTPGKDEKLILIARPQGNKMVSRGVFHGSYMLRGQEYWSAKLASRDGYSGSPVYNHKAEIVGVFTGYDWVQDVALISPAINAQKLLEDLNSSPKP
jgi:S1-C subfamily serine protease